MDEDLDQKDLEALLADDVFGDTKEKEHEPNPPKILTAPTIPPLDTKNFIKRP